METEMRFILRVPLLLMMFSLLANAQEQSIQKQNVQEQNIQEQNIQVGHGVLCDTVRQVERFVSLRDNGKDVRGALQTVNDEAQNAAACNLALFMFAPGKPIAELTIKRKADVDRRNHRIRVWQSTDMAKSAGNDPLYRRGGEGCRDLIKNLARGKQFYIYRLI